MRTARTGKAIAPQSSPSEECIVYVHPRGPTGFTGESRYERQNNYQLIDVAAVLGALRRNVRLPFKLGLDGISAVPLQSFPAY